MKTLLLASTAIACAALVGCMGLRSDTVSGAAADTVSNLPPATSPIVVDPEDDSVAALLDALGAATGQIVLVSEQDRSILSNVPSGVRPGVEIPPAEAYPFVESILLHHGVTLGHEASGSLSMLIAFGPSPRRLPRRWKLVDVDELESYSQHPALLLGTVLKVSNVDVRQLSTTLRALLSDTNTQALIAAGERSLILRDTARKLIDTVRTIQRIDANGKTQPTVETEAAGKQGG